MQLRVVDQRPEVSGEIAGVGEDTTTYYGAPATPYSVNERQQQLKLPPVEWDLHVERLMRYNKTRRCSIQLVKYSTKQNTRGPVPSIIAVVLATKWAVPDNNIVDKSPPGGRR